MAAKLSDEDRRRIVSLFEMSQRASDEDADAHVKNEATNATMALLRLLAKYGLSLADIPEIQQQHEQAEAAKAAKKARTTQCAAGSAAGSQPNALELTNHVLQSYSDMQPHEYIASALWILHTHVFDRFQITPRWATLSPVRNCGKSKTMHVAARLVANAERWDNISAATLFRVIDQGPCTLLLDEGDNLGLKLDRTMRSVLNSGYQKGGDIGRTINGEPKRFSTFAPAAIGAIGTLPLPLLRRCIVITMHRSKRTDLKTIEMLGTPEETQRLEGLRRHIVEWAQSAQLGLDPQLPKILRGGRADAWRPLISVADSFSSAYWSKAARDTAKIFANGYYDEDACVALLYDIRTIFCRRNIDRIKSLDLIRELHELDDGVGIWNAWRGENDDQSPHNITQGEVAALLRRFDRVSLRPRTLVELGSREERGKAGRGYYRLQFERWWSLYCPERETDEGDKVRQLHPKAG